MPTPERPEGAPPAPRYCGECAEEMVPEPVVLERCPYCGDLSRPSEALVADAALLDALEHYAWRVWQADGQPWTIKVDAHGGAVLGQAPTVREALTQALRAVTGSEAP